MKRLVFLMTTMLVSLATWAGNLVTVEITFNSETFAADLQAIENDETHYVVEDPTLSWKAAYAAAGGDGFATVAESTVDKLKIVVTVPAGQTFDATAVGILNQYLSVSGRWAQYRAVDISSATMLTELPQGAFNGRDMIEEWYFPASITKIGRNALMSCLRARHLQFGSETSNYTNITEIENDGFHSFGDMSDGVSMSFPNLTSLGEHAFHDSGITTFPIAQNNTAITAIPNNCFEGCKKLTSIVVPNSVTTINGNAFNGCSELTSLTFGASVNLMYPSAVANCPKLTAYNVDSGNAAYSAVDGLLLTKDGTEIVLCPQAKSAGETMDLSGTQFDGVQKIGQNAFEGSQANKIILPENLHEIAAGAWRNALVKEIVIGENITSVDAGAFKDAKLLETFSGTSTNANCYTTLDGILYKNGNDGQIKTLGRVPEGMTEEELVAAMAEWPKTLTELGPTSFENCKNLTSVVLPETIKSFGTHTFAGCTGLTEFTLPRDLETFGDAPFQFCENLATVNAGNNTNFIVYEGIIYEMVNGEKVLYYCPPALDVEEPIIARDTKEIAAEAFAYTSKIKVIKVPQGVHNLDAGAFHSTGAETIIIPHSVTGVAGADVFAGCQNLKQIYWLPDRFLGFWKTSQGGQTGYTSNMFYQSKIDQISVYVSNEYTDSHEGVNNGAETSLVELYSNAKGNGFGGGGNNKGFGDCKEVVGIYHRAITEDTNATNLGNPGNQRTNPTYANMTSANDYDFITLYRDFSKKEGETVEPYYTLVLPVNMSATEVAETFGPATGIWHFGGREDRVLKFNKATTIVAGEPCVIRPEYRATSYLIDLRKSSAKTAVAVDNSANAVGDGKQAAGSIDGESYDYNFKATYQQGATVPAHSYYVTNTVKTGENGKNYGVIKFITNASKFSKGLRGYIHSNFEELETANPAKDMDFSGVVTAIDDVPWEDGFMQPTNFKVYNLNGQLVKANANSMEDLPAGVYVVNGKKTIVK